jgi:hypothetical protein
MMKRLSEEQQRLRQLAQEHRQAGRQHYLMARKLESSYRQRKVRREDM